MQAPRCWRMSLAAVLGTGLSLNALPTAAAERDNPHNEPVDAVVRAGVAEAARIEKDAFEATKKARNDRLNSVFRAWVKRRGGHVTAPIIQQFYGLLRQHGLTSFADFLTATTGPLQEVTDPASGDRIRVYGALGSDVINSWLAAAEIIDGRPLEKQPAYRLAAGALREHIDFALVGLKDPNLSFDRLPPRLRENARRAYQRLNPGNKFEGGFDHPLFYATVREAARKLFREDYPEAHLTMADVVAPEEQGGFGIRSCLLCHDRNHTGVYKRLLGQHLHLKDRAQQLRRRGDHEWQKLREEAAVYGEAARTVQDSFPGKVDAQAARSSLFAQTGGNVARLKPGYGDFYASLKELGCLRCHSTDGNPPLDRDPEDYGVWMLNPNGYHKAENIRSLIGLVDTENVPQSPLLLKATADVPHEGSRDVTLDTAQAGQFRDALHKWLHTFNDRQTESAASVSDEPSSRE